MIKRNLNKKLKFIFIIYHLVGYNYFYLKKKNN
jgi:hypothetical protein